MTPKEALEIARTVGEEVQKAIKELVGTEDGGKVVGIGKDGTPTNKIDKVAEDVALSILRQYDVKVVSEEAGIVGDGDVYVALDPIDGTFNAIHGIPIYSISLCFSNSERLGDAFFGYVLNLAINDEYYALDGKAYKNGRRISVSKKFNIEDIDVIMYYPTKKYNFKRLRIFGSAALELCFVAEGIIDCFIDVRNFLRIFDVAAGIFIAKNAGAYVTDLDGSSLDDKRFNMEERLRLVVANPELHRKILKLIN